MNKKKFLSFFSFTRFWSISLIGAVGVLFTATAIATSYDSTQTNNATNKRISLQDEKKLINKTTTNSIATIGTLRRWQNNNFTGIQLLDKGFAALTGDSNSGYSVSRTNAFGGVLWTYNPNYPKNNLDYQKYVNVAPDIKNNYDANSMDQKGVVEIQQDPKNPQTYYALLVPKAVLDPTSPSFSGWKRNYDEIVADPTLQATVVQIKENLVDLNNLFVITAFTNISPQTMVQNYPSTWTVANGSSFFAKADHPSWFDNSATMNMGADKYITNLGNMYIINGYVLIFGGNGSQFTDPDALSIGVFRLDFRDPKAIEVTGIPYAYILAGLSTSFYSGRYLSRLPVGQDTTFSYVPRMAVGGVSAWPNLNFDTSPIAFLAGSLTVGQDTAGWNYGNSQKTTGPDGQQYNGRSTSIGLTANGRGMGSYGDTGYVSKASTTAVSGSEPAQVYTTRWSAINPVTRVTNTTGGTTTTTVTPNPNQQTNFIPTSALQSMPTQKNSIDPLTLAGFKLNLASILNLETGSSISNVTSSSADRSYLYIIDSSYFDFGINMGFILGFYMGPVNDPKVHDEEINMAWASGGPGQYGRPQQAWDGGLGMFTSLFGYSPKSVSNLIPFDSKRTGVDQKENNLGFVMQVGAFIYFFNLTGYDGYAQLSDTSFNPVITNSTLPPNTVFPNEWIPSPTTILNNTNGNNYNKYYTYVYMPASAYYYDALVGNSPPYFNGYNNQLATADPTLLANVKPWSEFVGLSVINTSSPLVSSIWINNDKSSSVYASKGFNGAGLTDGQNKTINASVTNLGSLLQIQTYPFQGSFFVNKTSNGNALMDDFTSDDNGAANLSNISGIINTPNGTSYFFQQNGAGLSYYSFDQDILNLKASFQNAVTDQKKYLGTGTFISNPSEIITTKNVSKIYDLIGNEMILKPSLFAAIFNYHKPDSYIMINNEQVTPETRILVTDINVVTQTATFTAQVKNPFTSQYVTIPSPQNNVTQNANITYQEFFGQQPGYLLAIAIAIPIIIAAAAIVLGLSIGIPVSRNKKALKKGFIVSHKKVDTLTTAIGSVFKKIIKMTDENSTATAPKILEAKKPKLLGPTKKPSPPKLPSKTAPQQPKKD